MAAPTVLLIGSNISAGFTPGMRSAVVVPSDEAGDIGMSIELLLSALPRRAKNVYVLTSDIWSQAVSLESRVLRRVEKNQIPQMVAFEAEALSGVPVSQSRMGLALLDTQPQQTTYWISQVDATRFAQVDDAVSVGGGKLMGMLHPAGLPVSLCGARGDWSRVELWDDLTIAVGRSGRQVVHRLFEDRSAEISSTADARRFLTSVPFPGGAHIEMLRESLAADGRDEEFALDLTREEHLHRFLAGWAAVLRKPASLPIIQPLRAPAAWQSTRTLVLASAAVGILAVVGHSQVTKVINNATHAALTQEVAEREQAIQQHSDNRKRLAALEAQRRTAQTSADELQRQLQQYRQYLDLHRSRIASLLQLLSDERPEHVVINSIRSEGDDIKITGRSITARSVEALAEKLAPQLEPLRFSIEVPRCEALLLSGSGAPYEFEFVIRDNT